MSTKPEITQQDLRFRSAAIMDALESGQAFTIIRDGRRIGELIPFRRPRRFVSRQEFAAMSRTAAWVAPDSFRTDQEAAADHSATEGPWSPTGW